MQTDNEKYNETVQPNTAFLNELKEKLPEFFTKEGSFDLDKFKDQLKDKNVNELNEGYQLDFIGKDYARRQAGEMPSTVIVPDEKQNQGEGKDSKNLFFTGDNLEVLRHLQNNYQNKIDVIYIDPPYNTGSDGFVYPDSFEYSDGKLKDMFGLDDSQVERLKSIQGKSSHSAWLTFMYPRLVLGKRLLKDSGVIYVSIDENEVSNLKNILDEIFGESNYQSIITRLTGTPTGNGVTEFVNMQDYILVYSKDSQNFETNGIPLSEEQASIYNEKDTNGKYLTRSLRRTGGEDRREDRPSMYFGVKAPDGSIVYPKGPSGYDSRWVVGQETYTKMEQNGRIAWKQNHNGDWQPYQKFYLNGRTKKASNIWDGFGNKKATKELRKLFADKKIFDFPKPVSLLKQIESISGNNSMTILDFFAGSSTTADAVMQLNAEDGGQRKFIMVQLPEKTYHTNKDGMKVPTKGGKAAYDAGFKSIDQISRERIRRAAKKIREDNELTLPQDFDGSFKHYRVVKPVKRTLEEIDDFDPNNTNLFTNMVDGFSSQTLKVDGDASGEETILTTWLAKDGYAFDAEVQDIKLGNYTAHKVEDNHLYLINEGWGADQTKELLNQLGTHQLEIQSVVLFGYSFNVAELRELENGLKQLDSKVTLIKRY
ncbi:site-specific DNA-methyltransferase [Lactobacillus crispatus]|uniref:site-specific DNA-methyltransferase n=1 Tax=Lactobacillaceae TaxID=33958 RepID=UPI0025A46AC5|nr:MULTISPECIES: site-specific DNA-methyltransferase [Lactobacillaceae]MDM8290369.1 site-specific DNA-methyltransferase [Lactobacillus crispatus]WKB73196.1 site-specific DNA-methyltransferase [Ligilactobacillus animalis]